MMRRLLLIILLFATTGYMARSQALSDYGFSAFSGTYSSLSGGYISSSGGTGWGSTIYDDCYYDNISIGFNFVYCGNTYNFLSASQNCWVMLGQTFGSTLYNTYDCDLSNTVTGGFGNYNLPRPILAALWLDVLVTANNVRYSTTGTTPNRVFTIEWNNCGLYPSSTAAESVQMKLYETTNIIDFIYSNISSGSTSTGHLSIGITNGTGSYPVTGTIGYWSLNGTGSTPTPSMTTESKFLTGLPATNQVYRWSPQCVGTPTAGTVTASTTTGCSSYTSTLTLSGYSTALGITFQWQSAPTSSGAWTNIPGATNDVYTPTVTSTQWYRCVVLCSNSGLSATTTPIQLVLNTPPSAITGTGAICVGASLTLSSATTGGTWTSGSLGVATVGSSSGVVTGVSPGTAVISYTLATGCSATAVVTVMSTPSVISGSSTVCVGQTITLTNSVAGGTWSSSSSATGTVGATTGIVGGIATGVVTISYTIGACTATKSITVNASPAGISGPSTVCVGSSITLTNSTSGGTWTSSNPFLATVGSSSGIVTGVVAGAVNITYTLPGGCYAIKPITVNALPGSITGLPFVCVGQTTTLFALGTGTWSSSDATVAAISLGGVVTGVSAGSATITFTATTGCFVTFSMTVLSVPAPITGDLNLCVGMRDTLSSATSGGIWSSSAAFIASISGGSGVDTGIAVGTATISYTVGSCSATTTVTVHPSPGFITGPSTLCAGTTGSYFSSGGGTWSISNPSVATIGSSSGSVIGVAGGTAVISYTMPSGCYATKVITVNPLPAAISGPSSVCVGMSVTLSDATSGGYFSSASPFITLTSGGIVTGSSVGTAIVTYTLPTGCYVTRAVTVTTSPAVIAGPSQVCIGGTITLSNAIGGGTWTSSNPLVATIGSASGSVSGIAAGVTTITYAIGTSCFATKSITVNPLPSAISGPSVVCVGATITLSSPGGGSWASGSTSIATIGSSSGVVTGVNPGIAVITYILPTGCSGTKTVIVNPLPAAIGGPSSVCIGSTITLTSSSGGGSWTTSSAGVAGVGSSTGVVTGASAGVVIITYTVASGCFITRPVTVNPLPSLCTVTGGGNFCAGASGRHIGLGCSSVGVNYQLFLGAAPVGTPLPGTGGILDFGLISAPGTYTVVATNATTGCSRAMSGSATITVDPPPPPISGPSAVCAGSSITLTDASAGGSWTSSTPSIATIGLASGIVSGITTGTTRITYTLPTGCLATTIVTVSPAPSAITGPSVVCEMTIITLSNSVPGGAWSSSNPSVATVGSLSGIVTGIAAGTTTITYSLGSGCTVTKLISVNPAPAPISGASSICIGATTTYTSSTPGIAWYSMDATIATVGASTGIVAGVGVGTTAIICSLMTTGCYASKVLTVNPLPTTIGGPLAVCVNSTATLTNGISGGTWTSGATGIATIGSSSGIVTGVSAGTATITYSLGSGCTKTAIVTVNPLPAAISGAAQACVGLTTTLTAGTPGGTWSTTTPAIGTVSSAGVVTGLSAGFDTVYYTLTATGCRVMRVVTINPLPAPITGSANICVTQTSLLSNTTPGGTWSSGAPAIATVSSSGLVAGVAFGMAPITYTAGGCWVTTTATVIASPGAISGSPAVCLGDTIILTNPTSGGSWSSSNPSVATVGSATGVVTGIASGTVAISYTLGTGCTRIMPVISNAMAPIIGPNSVCVRQTALFRDTALAGTWSSSNPSVATVSSTGWVTGIAAGIVTITYARTGCIATKTITIDPVPAPISGTPFACVGQMRILSNTTPGGAWSSSMPTIGSIDAGGVVSAIAVGYTTISYTLGTGCASTVTFSINGTPPAIAGPAGVCIGYTSLYTNSLPGGVWSSSAPAVGSISSSGLVRGISTGTTTISYMMGSGCAATRLINVDPLPAPISGPPQVCVASTATLSSTTSGGSWSSSSPSIATIDVVTGVVTGVMPGVATIFYTMPGGCNITKNITVNALPAAISGSTNVCVGGTTLLSNSVGGGTWTSSATGIASVSSTGSVTGISAGAAIISYTLATGCLTSVPVNVNPAPLPITGTPNICLGLTTALSSGTPGGTWSSSNPSIAPVDLLTGVVTGAAIGTATITYTVAGTGCSVTLPVFVNPFPTPIIGAGNVCVGASVTLSDAVPGGTWSSSNPSAASVLSSGPGTGLVTGILAGPVTIYYSLGTGCTVSLNLVVDPAPAPVVGANRVCATETAILSSGTPGGIWSSSTPVIASVGSVSGVVTGVTSGTTVISYTNGLGCSATFPFTVNPMPAPIAGPANVCLSSVYTFADALPGGKWYSYNPSVVRVDSLTGVVTGVSLGAATIRYEMPTGCFVTKAVTVYPLPLVFTVTGGGNHCDHDSGVHIRLSGSTVGINYMLYLGAAAVGAFPGTGSPIDFGLHTLAGTYTVKAISTSTSCAVNMAGSALVGVIPSVTPVVSLNVTPDDTVCVGTTASFVPVAVNGGSAPVFSWTVNGIPVSVGGSYMFIPADGDIITVSMTSNAVCPYPATVSRSVTMDVQPFGYPSATVALSPNDTVCKGTMVTANAITSYAGSAPAYAWYKNGTVVSYAGSSYSFVASDGDEIFYILTSNHPCRLADVDSSARVRETVMDPVLPIVTISASGTTVAKGEAVTLTALVADAVKPTYQWYINGLPVSGATNATYVNSSYSFTKQDSVSCAVTSHDICEVTTHQWVYINVVTTGIGQAANVGDILVLPNPNKGVFTIKGSLGSVNDEEITLEITNVLGQVLHRATVSAKGGKLNEQLILNSSIANGMYLLNLRSVSETRVFYLIVER